MTSVVFFFVSFHTKKELPRRFFRCGSSFFVWKETKKNTTDVISLYSFFGVPGLKTIPYRYACGLHAGTGTDVCGTCDGHSGFFTGDRFL